jgi:hypothetical protein
LILIPIGLAAGGIIGYDIFKDLMAKKAFKAEDST